MIQKENEIWKNIPGYEGYYQASNLGRVRSVDRGVLTKNGQYRMYKGKILRGGICSGYQSTGLCKEGVSRVFQHSQLVAMAFLNHKPDRYKIVVDHINGDISDDRLSNLRVVTHRENLSSCFRSDKKKQASQYVGVNWSKRAGKWYALIQYKGVRIYLGSYDVELDASMAYQTALGKIKDSTFKREDYRPKRHSKYKGVTFCKNNRVWIAQITVNKKTKRIGNFKTELEAHNAYQKALKQRQNVTPL